MRSTPVLADSTYWAGRGGGGGFWCFFGASLVLSYLHILLFSFSEPAHRPRRLRATTDQPLTPPLGRDVKGPENHDVDDF